MVESFLLLILDVVVGEKVCYRLVDDDDEDDLDESHIGKVVVFVVVAILI